MTELEQSFLEASSKGYIEKVKEYIKNGLNVNVQNKFQHTALLWASFSEYEELIKLLLDNNANVNAQDENGNTPLILLAKYKNIEMVRLLLDHNAIIDIKNNNGETVLDIVKERLAKTNDTKFDKIIEMLKEVVLSKKIQFNDCEFSI